MPFDAEDAPQGYSVIWTINKRKAASSGGPNQGGNQYEDAWEDFFITPDNDREVTGFYVQLTGLHKRNESPGTNPETGEDLPEEEVTSTVALTDVDLTFTCTNRDDDMFTEENRLYKDENGSSISVGIENNSFYQWDKVFDQSTVKYLPALSASTPFVDGAEAEVGPVTGASYPDEPYDDDADPPVYPLDTITSLRPDTRPNVTLVFTASFNGKVGPSSYSETVTWTKVVWQDAYNWGAVVDDALEKSYFTNGFTSDKR